MDEETQPTEMAISISEYQQMHKDLRNLKRALSQQLVGFQSNQDWVIEAAYQIVANSGGWSSATFPDE